MREYDSVASVVGVAVLYRRAVLRVVGREGGRVLARAGTSATAS